MSESKHTLFSIGKFWPKEYKIGESLWIHRGDSVCPVCIIGSNCRRKEAIKDAEYIIKTANAYPELIGRIKEQNKLMANISILQATVKVNQALLKKLGEL